MKPGWKTHRVVVEVPVKGTSSEKTTRWLVELCLQKADFDRRLLEFNEATGRTLVKQAGRVEARTGEKL